MSFLLEIIKTIRKMLAAIIYTIRERFLRISLPEKIIFLNIIPAFFAIVLPVARFYIFETYFDVNNPLAVYMIGIMILMIASIYFNNLIKLIIRSIFNLYYLFWIIYIPLTGGLTKAQPHEISFGYYLNIAVPAIFIISSLLSYYVYRENE